MKSKNIAIAIDGPAAAGKSTVSKLVAKKLQFVYVDTGAMYRALTLTALEAGADLESEEALLTLLQGIDIVLMQHEDGQKVLVNHNDVTEAIRTNEVTNNVSVVAKHPLVRKEMVRRQQNLAADNGIVMDGRDIGTRVLPDADVKIFMIASVEERAERRYKENIAKGFEADLAQLKEEIRLRDKLDSEREASPLVKAEDAVEIDTTSLSIEGVVEKILDAVYDVIGR
ncbi:cytidylate kinase [Terribacillus halophilus]|uniref:Cytidylate kinase n=1 Tax=Terribacillus halophilus TaxID=361279 RepID=A0A1G6V0E2_9BACI|nr:(d)CMP kinase [Terribacillus halophilus]SDD47060.1 cytidylate kinase [Terribacillus halophilus]